MAVAMTRAATSTLWVIVKAFKNDISNRTIPPIGLLKTIMNRPHNNLQKHIKQCATILSALIMAAACYAATPQPHHNDKGFSTVAAPTVPAKLKFCGQEVDLDPVARYERLDRELTSMAYTHGTTMLVIKRANRYFPLIAPILEREGVPSDLVYLACIESSLNPTAVSGAKAAGLWQFMPATAKEYGLEVNDYVDERFDPEKSTAAAARYLKRAYSRFGNWESVAASYNAGQGRISSELDRQSQNSAYDLYLNNETSRYIYRMLAMKSILENPRAFGYTLSEADLYQPYEYETVEVTTPVDDWAKWAADHGVTYLQLRDHNPWIRSNSLPNKTGKTYTVKLPTKKSSSRHTQQRTLYNKAWIGQ